jgi:hypothetical protein
VTFRDRGKWMGKPTGPIIRLHPTEVISWGMEFAGE